MKALGAAVYPVFIGLVAALALNAPVKLLERSLFSSPKLKKWRRLLSVSSSLIVILGVLTLVGFLIAPEIAENIGPIGEKLSSLDSDSLKNYLKFLGPLAGNIEKLTEGAAEKLSELVPKAVDAFGRGVRLVLNFLIGLVFGVLIVINKEKLAREFSRLARYFFGEERAVKITAGVALASDKFSKFLGGQLLEALIFGVIVYLVMLIFKIPYAAIVALLMALGNLVPMIGGYVAGAAAFIVVFTASVEKALVFVAIILILQQVEQFTTYPLIVGRYVGISSFWILFAVVVGGGLFGFWGLVLGVPAVAFIDNFFKVMSDRKLGKIKA